MRRVLGQVLALAFASASVCTSAMAQSVLTPPNAAPAQDAAAKNPIDPSYILGPGDIVEVGIVGRDDFNTRARVGADGKILLPYIGSVVAANRSTLELADDIRKALVAGGYFAKPVVRAEAVGIASRYATVLGSVGSPGLVPLDRKYRLSEVLARVGGRTGAGADYVLLTRSGGGASERYSIAELASGIGKDPEIESGDKIFVPSAQDEVFYVSGQIRNAGPHRISPGMTLRMALAEGGGITENGSEGRVTVMRHGQKLKIRLDDPIAVGDVITVGERLF